MAQPPHAQQSASDITASLILLAATAAALIVANTPLYETYKTTLLTPVSLNFGDYALSNPLKIWIKDALMGIFFLFVGLEIKSEFKEGTLSDRKRAILPFIAAAGGMLVPAIIYLSITWSDPSAREGWAIPAATDIAFAVGVIGLLGKLVPPALKAFLLAVAVIDDLGAIIIIALFYTHELHIWALGISAVIIVAMAMLNARDEKRIWPYMVLMVALWVFIQQSGVSATLAGVIAAIFVPLKGNIGMHSPLHHLVNTLKLPVAFFIMPLFAFSFAGVPFSGMGWDELGSPVTFGIWMGLMIGKPVGITLATVISVKSGLAKLPGNSGWLQVMGAGCIAGIGFTMSLFIGVLAFGDGELLDNVRIGVLVGSLTSTLLGIALFWLAAKRKTV